MKINIFGLNKHRDYKEVKRVLHEIWCFNQKPPYLPMWCDTEFQQCFNYIKKKYDLDYLKRKFELM